MTVNNDHICYIYIIYIIIKTDMNASWMLVYFIIRWWSQGKIIGMSQGKICYKVNFFKRYISMILMHISILFSLVMYSILDDIRWWSQGKIIRMSQGKICHLTLWHLTLWQPTQCCLFSLFYIKVLNYYIYIYIYVFGTKTCS